MTALGLDIGGANIKAATRTHALSVPFAVWKRPDELASRLAAVVAAFPGIDQIAVVMTAELADCYRTRSEGVSRIVDDVMAAVPRGMRTRFWSTDGCWLSAVEAPRSWRRVAAANWHALAACSARWVEGDVGLLLDVGSTTADIIPLRRAPGALQVRPVPAGTTDTERLISGELVYSGMRRTPLCAVARGTIYRGQFVPLAAELFATTLDLHLVRGDVAESTSVDTADGRPQTVACARDRLARQICVDPDDWTPDDARVLADDLAGKQLEQLAAACRRVVARAWGARDPAGKADSLTVVIAGSGGRLAERVAASVPELAAARSVRLAELWDEERSAAACACAAAHLAEET